MPSFRFIHCADLHLDSPLRGLEAGAPAGKIRDASREAFSALVTYAIEQKIDFVLAAGDLYDGDWQDYRTGQFLVRELARLDHAGIPFVAIRGNHDAESVITRRLQLPESAKLLRADKPETHHIQDLDVAVHGQSFANRAVAEDISRNYPAPLPGKFNIGLLHTNIDGVKGHEDYAPCRSADLIAHGYQYWALGHIHQKWEVSRDPWVIYPGNIQGRHIRETEAKGAMIVTVTDGCIVAPPVFFPFDTVRWDLVDVDVAAAIDLDSALAAVRPRLRDAVAKADGRLLAVRIELTGATQAHAALTRDANETRERLKAEAPSLAGSDDIWIEDVKLLVTPPADTEPLPQALAEALEAEPPDELHRFASGYARELLDRVAGLRDALGGNDHPAVATVDHIPEDLLERARALLRARLSADPQA
jgi:DNA repair protein SbcD/Mre11